MDLRGVQWFIYKATNYRAKLKVLDLDTLFPIPCLMMELSVSYAVHIAHIVTLCPHIDSSVHMWRADLAMLALVMHSQFPNGVLNR